MSMLELARSVAKFIQRRTIAVPLVISLATAASFPAHAQDAGARMAEFSISASALADALSQFGIQSGLQVVYSPDLPRGLNSKSLSGRLSTDAALTQMLTGTGLTWNYVNGDTVVLKRAESQKISAAGTTGEPRESSSTTPQADSVATVAEEIVVTARKREERLQDVPASIAAASGETIADLNIVGVTELDTIAPGLTFATNPSRFGSGPAIALRGISTQTQSSGMEDSVGIVIDGVPISRAKAGAFPNLSDVERVEVLRGPQGTLFGMNASAGLISVTTKDPTDRFESDVELEYSTHDDRAAKASVSGPIVDDRLLGRLSVYSRSRDGYVENILDGSDWEADDQQGVRAKLLFTTSDFGTFKLTGDFTEQKNDAGANIIRGFTAVTPQYVRDALADIAGPENDKINARSLGSNRQQSGGASLQWDRDFNEHTLTATVAYRDYDQDAHAGTYTWLTPLNEGDQFFQLGFKQYSGEVRLASPSDGRLDYVAGLFVLDNDIDSSLHDPSTLVVQTGSRFGRYYISEVQTWNYAAFGEANLKTTERLTLTAGLRWTHEEVDIDITGLPIAAGLARVGHPLGTTSDSASVEKLSWRVGAQWQLHEDRMLYVSGSTGFKGPAFNNNTSTLGNAQPTREETSTNVEIGLKSQFFDRRVTFNIDAFHTVFKDFQTQGGLFLPGNPLSQIVLLNAGELVTKGIEAELAAALLEATRISMNAAYIDATFKKYENAPCYPGAALRIASCASSNVQDLTGTRLPNTPKWNVNVLAQQEFMVPGWTWAGFASLDYSWRSSVQWHNLGSPDGLEGSYGLLGAALGLRSDDERIQVKVYGKNLTDKFHTSGISVGDQITHFLPPDYRRVLGINAAFKF
jgi:iron complex outermembrane recepter protein